MLLGWSPDGAWMLFANDPMGSQSIIADGIRVQAVSIREGGVHEVAAMLANEDYRAWCGGRLVLTAGGDRIATTNKRLLVTRRVYALRDGKLLGSLASLGYSLGYYGHNTWAYTLRR